MIACGEPYGDNYPLQPIQLMSILHFHLFNKCPCTTFIKEILWLFNMRLQPSALLRALLHLSMCESSRRLCVIAVLKLYTDLRLHIITQRTNYLFSGSCPLPPITWPRELTALPGEPCVHIRPQLRQLTPPLNG